MAFDLPFEMLALFIGVCITLVILSFRAGRDLPFVPFFATIAGILWISIFALTDNVLTSVETIDYSKSYLMNVTSGSSSIQLANTNYGAGEKAININSALFGKKGSCIMLDLSKSGSPTGTATFGILGGAGTVIKSFGTIDVSTLTTSQKSYTICLPNHDYWLISLYERVGIFYSGGSAGNGVNVYLDATDPFDGANSDRSTLSSGGTWTDVSNSDLHMVIMDDKANIIGKPYSLGDSTNANWYIRVYFSLIGLAFISLSILQLKENKK